jgi:1,4-alpha-glucan branching enzyme
MFLVDTLHQAGIGVIFDWVPGFFADGENGLAYFDGTHLYERGGWPLASPHSTQAHRFDFTRREVRSFLASNAFYWLEKYHADGLKVDAASSILLLDHGHRAGEWVPNRHGGRENPDGIAFLRQLNTEISRVFPDVLTVAEERTSWPMATHSPERGGLGFTLRWEPEFAGQMLGYLGQDSTYRRFQHEQLNRRAERAVTDAVVLPLSHRETGAGKGSFLARMAGDEWQRFANLRLLLGYQYTQPGKKLLFMGTEFAQWETWKRSASLDWHLLAYPNHSGMQLWVGDLNKVYREESALHDGDGLVEGFEWVDQNDSERSTLSWLRRDGQRREVLLVVCNFTPTVLRNVHVGVRRPGHWREILNSDAAAYGGSGQGNFGGASTAPFPSQHLPHTLSVTAPPLGMVVFKHAG